eukprot:3934981-Rhodomonas_salina.2
MRCPLLSYALLSATLLRALRYSPMPSPLPSYALSDALLCALRYSPTPCLVYAYSSLVLAYARPTPSPVLSYAITATCTCASRYLHNACYALSGTRIGSARGEAGRVDLLSYALSGTDAAGSGMRCCYWYPPIFLRAPYSMSGTDIRVAASVLRAPYAMVLRLRYAVRY